MLRLLKRHFWAIDVAAVVACAALAANAAVHYLGARHLPVVPPMDAPTEPAPGDAQPRPARSKSGSALAARNMFCHECTPPEPTAAADEPIASSDRPPETELPLRLLATHVSAPQAASVATVANTSSAVTGAYRVSNQIPEAGEILRITGKYIDFTNAAAGRVERLSLAPEPGPTPTQTASRPPRPSTRQPPSELDEQIRKVDDTRFEIDRELVDKLLANPAQLRGVRPVPAPNGDGIRLYAVRPSSVAARLGLQNGDTLHTVNGFRIGTPDEALEAYSKLRNARAIEVQVTRRGKPTTLRYAIE